MFVPALASRHYFSRKTAALSLTASKTLWRLRQYKQKDPHCLHRAPGMATPMARTSAGLPSKLSQSTCAELSAEFTKQWEHWGFPLVGQGCSPMTVLPGRKLQNRRGRQRIEAGRAPAGPPSKSEWLHLSSPQSLCRSPGLSELPPASPGLT